MASILKWLISYAQNIASEVAKNFNSWLAKAILALITASALLLVTPLKDNYLSPFYRNLHAYFFSVVEIEPADALRIAKRHVGQNAVFALPFHNAGDPNQFIAVWALPNGGECDYEKEPQRCPNGWGGLVAYVLVGNDGVYSVTNTNVPAFPSHLDGMAAEGGSSLFWRFAGLTDWNNDGHFEMLSISDQSAMTAPQHVIFVSLYDSHSMKLSQLRVRTPPDTSELVGEQNASLRAWLTARYEEYFQWSYEGCSRARNGVLTCAPIPPAEISDEAVARLLISMRDDWVELNGNDFTTGQLKLGFRPSREDMAQIQSICDINDGTIRLLSVFKGPLIIENLAGKEAAVLYKQDDKHHREIPSLILGKKFIWMGLRDERGLLAIDRESQEVKSFGIENYTNLFGTPEDEKRDEFYYPAKDRQIEGLSLSAGILKVGDEAIRLLPGDITLDLKAEFASAPFCNIWE